MATRVTEHSARRGSELALERLTELATRGEARYPSGTIFMGSDMPDFELVLLRHIREGRPMVIVFPDGEEVFIEARRPWEWPRSRLLRALRRRLPLRLRV
jgi:hypothetical protein